MESINLQKTMVSLALIILFAIVKFILGPLSNLVIGF